MVFKIDTKMIEVNENFAGGVQLFNLTDNKYYYLSSEECKGFIKYYENEIKRDDRKTALFTPMEILEGENEKL